jgi:adenylate cyclase
MPNSEPNVTTAPPPSAEQVKAELARVLGSSVFAQAGRSTEFLRFVVEETLAGRADRLKGYTIAIEVFGKPPEFDAQTDPLVRVEAGRLRRRLIEYYHGDGRDDSVRIALPKNGYAPTFGAIPIETAPAAAPSASKLRRRKRSLLLRGAVLGSIVATAAALLTWFALYRGAPPAPAPALSSITAAARAHAGPVSAVGPRLLVLPVENLSGDASLDAVAAGTTEEVIRALVAFNIFATASTTGHALETADLFALRKEFDAGYVLTGSVRSANGALRFTLRLVDTEVGTQLWSRAFDEQADHGDAITMEERIGLTTAEVLSSPFGPVYGHEIARTAGRPIRDLDPYECLLRFYEYTRFFDPMGHADSLQCLQRAVKGEPRFAPAWSALGVLYLHEHLYGYSPQPDRAPPLDRALEAVRTSLDIDGSGRVAAVTLAGIRLASGDRRAFEAAVERPLNTKPLHPAAALLLGYLLIESGDWQRGKPLLDDASPLTTNVPGWANIGYAFGYLEMHDYAQALESSLRSDAPNWFVTPMTVTASAALAGRTDIAQREKARLLELYPDFESTGRAQIAKWHLDPTLLAALLDGLKLAGLNLA